MILKDAEVAEFKKILYHGACPKCKHKVEWEADFDADGTSYFTTCCELEFRMYPIQYIVYIDEKQEE